MSKTDTGSSEGDEPTRCQRLVRWPTQIDYTAKRLAAERDMAVNELLAALVEIEEKNPRLSLAPPTAGYREEIRRAEQLAADTYRRKGKER
ncbi:MAG: hypothetical protein WBW78_16900 [Terrimicrobiaceae bacterium]